MAPAAQASKSSKRLTEILGVLRRHHVARGLNPVKLREILEELGPTYVKLGQILSMRGDLLPAAYCAELEKLRTAVVALPFSTVRALLDEELGRPAGEVFPFIDPVPAGSASIAQAHAATLLSGERVILKVQRPRIRETMAADVALLLRHAKLLQRVLGTGDLLDFRSMVEELWATSQTEMDFLQEARNLQTFEKNRQGLVYITSPSVFAAYTTPRLLVMSDVGGIQIDELAALDAAGYDRAEIGRKAAENYCKQILDDRFFHADPHPGNLRIVDGKIAWIDFGMAGTISPALQEVLLKAIRALLDDDMYALTAAFLMLGRPEAPVDRSRLQEQLSGVVRQYKTKSFGKFDFAPLIEECLQIIKSNRILLPADVSLLCRSMVTMEGTLGRVSPEVNLSQILAAHMLSRGVDWKAALAADGRQACAGFHRALELPVQLGDVLELMRTGQASIRIQREDAPDTARRRRRAANRLVLAVLVLAFYLSAAVLCLAPVRPTVLGFPWSASAGFAAGTALTVWLVAGILRDDRR